MEGKAYKIEHSIRNEPAFKRKTSEVYKTSEVFLGVGLFKHD
jgi:hypothetical protein